MGDTQRVLVGNILIAEVGKLLPVCRFGHDERLQPKGLTRNAED